MSIGEDPIGDLIATWHKATARGDLSQLLTLMAEDGVFSRRRQPACAVARILRPGSSRRLRGFSLHPAATLREIHVNG